MDSHGIKKAVAIVPSLQQALPHDCQDFTGLHLASITGNIEVAKKLISKACDPYTVLSNTGPTGCTALHVAVLNKQIEMIKILLKKGSDFTLKNNNDETPLHIAFKLQCDEAVSLILQAYYTVCSRINEKIKRALAKSYYPIDISMIVYKRFLENFRPLHFAVSFQLVDIIPLLIDNGIDIQAKDSNGVTALDCAIQCTQMSLLKTDYLHKSLTETDCCNKDYSTFPENLFKIVDLLFHYGCDTSSVEKFGRPKLFYLLDRLNQRAYMRAAASLVPNLSACVYCACNAITYKLLSYNLDLTVADYEGNTVLHMMAKAGHDFFKTFEVDICQRYVQIGANLNALDNSGYTALHYACVNGDKNLIRFLVDHGADVNLTESKERERPIHATLKYLLKHPDHPIKNQINMVEQLLNRGAYVDATMRDGTTPILLATTVEAYTSTIPLILCLLKWGCDVNCADSEGRTPLHNICKLKFGRIIDDLMKHGADVNAMDRQGNTPFSFVFQGDSYDLVNSVDVYSYLRRLTVLGVPLCEANRKLHAFLVKINGNLTAVAKGLLEPRASNREINMNYDEYQQRINEVPTEEQCRAELDVMKMVRIDDDRTLYDILHSKSDEMVHCLSEETKNILTDTYFDEDYYIYGYLLKNKMKITNRGMLLEPAKRLLLEIFQANVPEVFDRICGYLSFDDLMHFTQAFVQKKNDETGSESPQDVKRQRLN